MRAVVRAGIARSRRRGGAACLPRFPASSPHWLLLSWEQTSPAERVAFLTSNDGLVVVTGHITHIHGIPEARFVFHHRKCRHSSEFVYTYLPPLTISIGLKRGNVTPDTHRELLAWRLADLFLSQIMGWMEVVISRKGPASSI